MKAKIHFLLIFLSIIGFEIKLHAQVDSVQYKTEGRKNSPEAIQKPYLILISIDGFRYDYAEKYQADNILNLAQSGVKAKAMIPSYPSNTFPNHYTLVTGLYPANHGLIDNSFYDPHRNQLYRLGDNETVRDGSWYGGLPIWGLAEKNNMVAASLFWVGSESNVAGLSPTYFYRYHDAFTNERKVEIVKEWLLLPEEVRPHLITVYFPEVDSKGHAFGPDAPETEAAVNHIDLTIGLMVDEIKKLNLPDVNFILVSDHGMLKADVENPIKIPSIVDNENFVVINSSSSVRIHVKDPKMIKPTYRQIRKENSGDYKVYLTSKTPKRWHFRRNTDDRLGEIILMAKAPKIFDNLRPTNRKKYPGTHGFDVKKVPEMKATFIAWGSAFKTDKVIGEFQNIHIYPLMANILGLPVPNNIDGEEKVLRKILK